MKFTLALVAAAAASSETGIKMLQKLNSMDQSIENMQDVKVAIVKCAAAGDCSAEAAAMPTLAMTATGDAATDDEATAKTDVDAAGNEVKDDADKAKTEVSEAVKKW
jgi:hypothetical protein